MKIDKNHLKQDENYVKSSDLKGKSPKSMGK